MIYEVDRVTAYERSISFVYTYRTTIYICIYYRIVDYYGKERRITSNDVGKGNVVMDFQHIRYWRKKNKELKNTNELISKELKNRKREFDRVYENLINVGRYADSFKWQRKKERKIIHDIKVMVSKG